MNTRLLFPALFLLALAPVGVEAQELYPIADPASNIPRQVIGIRLLNEAYNEVGQLREMAGLKVMYSPINRLSIYATATLSNHHSKQLPPDFPVHNTPQTGVFHPYYFNGVNVYAKYRFLSIDRQKSHLRIAAYGT